MINQDYKEILQCLEKHDVVFMLVGAYAMAAHGFPRSTGDIDIWVNPMDENSIRVVTVQIPSTGAGKAAAGRPARRSAITSAR